MIAFLFAWICSEPVWIDVPAIQALDKCRGSAGLADIESRMPVAHGYQFPNAPMTWAHETSHGLASCLRMQHGSGCNVLYVMRGKAIKVAEPKTTLWKVGKLVPNSLRGPSFQLYFGEQRRYWDDTPTYVLDEWTAYVNGSEVGFELQEDGWEYELLQAFNFGAYAIAMARSVELEDPEYDHTQLRALITHNWQRTADLYKRANNIGRMERIEVYRDRWCVGIEADKLRAFAEQYLGIEVFAGLQ
jgi:hypothetical protein